MTTQKLLLIVVLPFWQSSLAQAQAVQSLPLNLPVTILSIPANTPAR